MTLVIIWSLKTALSRQCLGSKEGVGLLGGVCDTDLEPLLELPTALGDLSLRLKADCSVAEEDGCSGLLLCGGLLILGSGTRALGRITLVFWTLTLSVLLSITQPSTEHT